MTRRSTSRVQAAGLVVLAALAAAACSEATAEELLERYETGPGVTPLPTPDPDAGGRADAPARDAEQALGPGETRASITPGEVVRATTISCPFDTSTVGAVSCGEVSMPGRGDADDEITITYAWFESEAAPEDRRVDPVVYLHGGPGGDIVEYADLVAPAVVDPFIDHRDVIVYDQRGGGLSSALPPCSRAWAIEPEYYSEPTRHEDLSLRYVDVIAGCGTSLGLNTDFDLSTYNSAVHADDLVDLRTALGIGAYNLYGSSYGSRLAQTVMRDHPGDVRSVIMSGVYPIEVNLIGSTPDTFRTALDTVFAACGVDPDCDDALPDPWAALQREVDRLDLDPVLSTVSINAAEKIDLVIAGDDLINSLHAALYRWDTAAMIPDLLIDLGDGDSSRLERLARDSISDVSFVAPYLTVQCREEAPFTTIDGVDAGNTGIDAVDRINLPPGLLGRELLQICDAWDVGPIDPAENDPVTWSQPTLLFSGGFDPITPASWAADMAARLPDAHYVHSVDFGHDSDESFCAQRIMAAFIESPDEPLSTQCAEFAEVPYLDGRALRWVSETAPDLATTTIDLSAGGGPDGIEITMPDWLTGWDGDTRMWWRDLDVLDLAVIVIDPSVVDPAFLEQFVDVDDAVVRLGSPTSPIPGWTRSSGQTPGMDLVLYQRSEPFEVSVALIAYDDDLDALEQDVMIAVVESIA